MAQKKDDMLLAKPVPPSGVSKKPSLALEHMSPATRLLEKRRQMFEVQEALDSQKDEFIRQEEGFRRREEALRRKDVELQDSLIKFNRFLQENETKRKRATTRAAEEKKEIDTKQIEIIRLQKEKEDQSIQAKALERDLKRNRVCEHFLHDCCHHMADDGYHEIQDILNRYSTLRTANHDLASRQKEYEEAKETCQHTLSEYLKQKSNEILNANNKIALLQKKLELSKHTTYNIQRQVDSAVRGSSDKTLELCQILASVDNLRTRFLKHMNKHKQQIPLTTTRQQQQQHHSSLPDANALLSIASLQQQNNTPPQALLLNADSNVDQVKFLPQLPQQSKSTTAPPTITNKAGKLGSAPSKKITTTPNNHQPADSLELEGKLAIDRLDEICLYMTDYSDILSEYEARGGTSQLPPSAGAPL